MEFDLMEITMIFWILCLFSTTASSYSVYPSNQLPLAGSSSPNIPQFAPYIPQRRLSISLSNLQPQIQPTPQPHGCGVQGAFQINDICFLIPDYKLNWNQANSYCQSVDYHLVEILTGDFYFKLIHGLRKGLYNDTYWVGACRNRNTGWHWNSDSQPIYRTFWAVSHVHGKIVKEPQPDFTENCVLLDASRAHFLNPAPCYNTYKFICQKNLSPQPQPRPQVFPQSFPNAIGVDVYFSGAEGEDNLVATCEEDWTLFEEEGKCYRAGDTNISFNDANQICKNYNASLVSITSQEENDFVTDFSASLSNYFWIGLNRKTSSDFEWPTGEEFSYHNWAPEQPDIHYEKTKTCVELNAATGQWSDDYCIAYKGFICEVDAHYETANK